MMSSTLGLVLLSLASLLSGVGVSVMLWRMLRVLRDILATLDEWHLLIWGEDDDETGALDPDLDL